LTLKYLAVDYNIKQGSSSHLLHSFEMSLPSAFVLVTQKINWSQLVKEHNNNGGECADFVFTSANG